MIDLNLRQTSYLLAVLDEGHFGRAAAKLFISPPALTQQVRKLERSVGAELLDRTAHPVRATPAGERFAAEARIALAAAERAVRAVQQGPDRIRMGFMTAAIGTDSRALLDRMRAERPDISVELMELPWATITAAVRSGRVDAALMRPPVADSSGLRFDVVCTEPRVVAVASDHRLAGRVSVMVADLDGEVHVDDDDADREWVRWWACDPRPSGVPVVYGPSVHTMDELLERWHRGRRSRSPAHRCRSHIDIRGSCSSRSATPNRHRCACAPGRTMTHPRWSTRETSCAPSHRRRFVHSASFASRGGRVMPPG
ncbi:LysR family transcriptional regulator [Gordonia sp. NPDC003424]